MRNSISMRARCARIFGALIVSTAVWSCGGGDNTAPVPVLEASIPAASVEVGSNIQLSVRNARGTITWTSSNTAVATVVSTGFVTAVGPGTATITATTPTQSASTLITVPALPAIRFSTASVAFTARAGGANPAAQTVAVTDSGGPGLQGLGIQNIQYTAGQPAGWLNASLSSPTATLTQASTLQLTATVAGLTPGVYTATVVILASSASNSPRGVTVTFTVAAQPTIELSSTTAQFSAVAGGANPAASVINVTSLTTQATGLSRTIAYDQPGQTSWLTASLNTTTTPATLTLQALTGALPQGTYSATVSVASPDASNSPRTVTVLITVAPPPQIDASVTSFTFAGNVGSGNPVAQTSQLTNGGGGTLAGLTAAVSYTSGNGWLNVSVSPTTAPTTLSVQPILTGLAVGTYTATVRVSAPGAINSPRDFPVTLTVGPQAAIAVSPGTLSFFTGGANPAAQTVAITNSGGATLSGLAFTVQYTNGNNWLTTTLGSGTAPATLTVQPTTVGLAAGTYNATISITSSVASNSPRTIPVTLTISSSPSIVAAPNLLNFSASTGNPPTQAINITNGGGGSLTGLTVSTSTTSGGAWLSASLSPTSAPATVTVTATRGALAAGVYTGNVRITAAGATNSPQDVPITFTVTTPPSIVASPTTLSFNSAATQTIAISNGGGGTLSGLTVTPQYVSGTGWLNVSITPNSAPATVTVTSVPTGLSPGTYTANIAVASVVAGNTPLLIPVTLSVPFPPTIGLSATTTTFSAGIGGANPAPQTVSVTNTGGGTLSGLTFSTTYTSGSNWLTLTPGGSTAPTTVTLAPSISGLAAGTYTATVNVIAAGASNSPRTIGVTLNVLAPSITLSSTTSNIQLESGYGDAFGTISVTNGGGGTLSGLSLTATSLPSLVTATLNTSTAPATITITAKTGTSGAPTAPGTYTATFQIASSLATNTPRTITVTFTVLVSLINNIYSQMWPSCSGCHTSAIGGANPVPALNSVTAFRNAMVGVANTGNRVTYPLSGTYPIRVVAGSPSTSYLMYQLNWATSPNASRMPTSTQLSIGLRTLMNNWILQGATNR